MSKPLIYAILIMIIAISTVGADNVDYLGWISAGGGGVELETEMEMESEISRRILATSSYISYGALRRNSVPCSRRGASYYNCGSGGQANPYSRGCSAITRCRR